MAFSGSGVAYKYSYYYTYSSHFKIEGYGDGTLLTLGMNDTIAGSFSSADTIAAIYAPSAGFYGTWDYLRGDGSSDFFAALVLESVQYTTLKGGSGNDTFIVGCNSNGSVNVTIEDFTIG